MSQRNAAHSRSTCPLSISQQHSQPPALSHPTNSVLLWEVIHCPLELHQSLHTSCCTVYALHGKHPERLKEDGKRKRFSCDWHLKAARSAFLRIAGSLPGRRRTRCVDRVELGTDRIRSLDGGGAAQSARVLETKNCIHYVICDSFSTCISSHHSSALYTSFLYLFCSSALLHSILSVSRSNG